MLAHPVRLLNRDVGIKRWQKRIQKHGCVGSAMHRYAIANGIRLCGFGHGRMTTTLYTPYQTADINPLRCLGTLYR